MGGGLGGGWPPAAPGADCDASIVPVVTGHLDHQLLDRPSLPPTGTLPRRPVRPGAAGSARPAPDWRGSQAGYTAAAAAQTAAAPQGRPTGRWLRPSGPCGG